MSETPRLTPARQAEHAARAERLAKALRENLHRRKQQAREKGAQSAPPASQPGPGKPSA